MKKIFPQYFVNNENSWFGEYAHRWPDDALPLGYAMACVEVVVEYSEEAKKIYRKIIESWVKPEVQESYEEFISDIPKYEKERWENGIRQPELLIKRDINEPWQDLIRLFDSSDFENMLPQGSWEILPQYLEERHKEVLQLFNTIFQFILVGFNRQYQGAGGEYKVIPTMNPPWLLLAVLQRTSFEAYNITLDKLRKIYKVRRVRGKIHDFEDVLTQQSMSRMHREIAKNRQRDRFRLHHDSKFLDAAWLWYQCRIVHPSIDDFLSAEAESGILKFDFKNVQKAVKRCDDALGYQKRNTIRFE